jgi:hypothetical protein
MSTHRGILVHVRPDGDAATPARRALREAEGEAARFSHPQREHDGLVYPTRARLGDGMKTMSSNGSPALGVERGNFVEATFGYAERVYVRLERAEQRAKRLAGCLTTIGYTDGMRNLGR